MGEFERTRVREKEAPALSSYELAIQQDRETAQRHMTQCDGYLSGIPNFCRPS